MELTCPKCQGAMRTYERSGVTVDQCTECRGIFLDRGELERLVDAEASWNQSPPQAPPPRPQQPVYQQSYEQTYRGDHPYDTRYGKPSKQKRRKSFLEELFD
jgi:Zn-finger nucleic acid-binding protein